MPFTGGSWISITGYALSIGTVADITSLASKTVDATVFDGSKEVAFDQFIETSINIGAGAVLGRVAGSYVRLNSAGRFYDPSNGRFVRNDFGYNVTTARDATNVAVSFETSQQLDN